MDLDECQDASVVRQPRPQFIAEFVSGDTSYTATLTTTTPGVTPGAYRIIVVADSRETLIDTDRTNNTTASASLITVAAQPLLLGQAVSGTIANGQDLYYRLDLATGRNVVL